MTQVRLLGPDSIKPTSANLRNRTLHPTIINLKKIAADKKKEDNGDKVKDDKANYVKEDKAKEAKEAKEVKEVKEVKEAKEVKEVKEAKEANEDKADKGKDENEDKEKKGGKMKNKNKDSVKQKQSGVKFLKGLRKPTDKAISKSNNKRDSTRTAKTTKIDKSNPKSFEDFLKCRVGK
jgi:cbb3-type cytochrome oxidase cytochrome c subunit